MKHHEKHQVNTTRVSVRRIKSMDSIIKRKALLHKLKKVVKLKGSFYMKAHEMTRLFGKPLVGRDLQYVEQKADEMGFTVFYDKTQNEYGIIADKEKQSPAHKFGPVVQVDPIEN